MSSFISALAAVELGVDAKLEVLRRVIDAKGCNDGGGDDVAVA